MGVMTGAPPIDATSSDSYEDDDDMTRAGCVYINDPSPQRRNFHDPGDVDWVVFHALAGKWYTMKASNLESGCNVVVTLIDHAGNVIAEANNPVSPNADETITRPFSEEGVCYVKLRHADAGASGEKTGYDFEIFMPDGAFTGSLKGYVTDTSGNPIERAVVRTHINDEKFGSAVTRADGYYMIIQESGTYTVDALADGYSSSPIPSIQIPETIAKELNIEMKPNPEPSPSPTPEPDNGNGGGGGGCFIGSVMNTER